jgi:tetratricopeptide (TPR) repeat protein
MAALFGDHEVAKRSGFHEADPIPRYSSLHEGLDAAEAARSRGDSSGALDIFAELRSAFPDQAAAHLRAGALLSQMRRFDEAATLLAQGAARFPDDPGFNIERAWLAQRRGDLAEALQRWAEIRRTLPERPIGYIGAARSLREGGRYAEADALLTEALERFPGDPAPRAEHAWVAQVARDWPEAVRRWDETRRRHPDQPVGFTAAAVALREMRRFDEAEALLIEASARFPEVRAPLVEHAWLAAARRDWAEAARRWALVRERFPEAIDGYLRGAQALSSLWQHEAAETLLTEAMERFPQDAAIACEHAWLAYRRHEFDETARRFETVRHRFPDLVTGYTGGAAALRDQFRPTEAEALLEEAHRRFPDDPSPLLEHARIPSFHPLRRERDPEETLRRAERLLAKFPFFEEGYLLGIRTLRELGRPDEADELGQIGMGLLPDSAPLAMEHANNARERGDWPEAIWRFGAARQRFPNHPGGPIGLAACLSLSGRDTEAEQVLKEAIERFPGDAGVFAEFAQIAVRREDWSEALARWSDAQKRFPDDQQFTHRIFEARMRLPESPATQNTKPKCRASLPPQT